jgi:hypothetical protein
MEDHHESDAAEQRQQATFQAMHRQDSLHGLKPVATKAPAADTRASRVALSPASAPVGKAPPMADAWSPTSMSEVSEPMPQHSPAGVKGGLVQQAQRSVQAHEAQLQWLQQPLIQQPPVWPPLPVPHSSAKTAAAGPTAVSSIPEPIVAAQAAQEHKSLAPAPAPHPHSAAPAVPAAPAAAPAAAQRRQSGLLAPKPRQASSGSGPTGRTYDPATGVACNNSGALRAAAARLQAGWRDATGVAAWERFAARQQARYVPAPPNPERRALKATQGALRHTSARTPAIGTSAEREVPSARAPLSGC